MPLPGRQYNASDYRHGFNGMEKDDEVKGSGNSYDFGARIYDPRIGRWLAIDPFASKYAGWSTYCAMINNPISFVDRNGDSVEVIIGMAYSKNGVEHPYGHMALRVFNSQEGYDFVFDFGRYGSIWGINGESGDGILNVYTSSQIYKRSEQAIRNSVGYTKPTTTEQDKAIIAYFQGLINNGQKYKTGAVPGGGGTAYKLQENYFALNNNCCTMTIDGLEQVGINWLSGEYKPLESFEIMENTYESNNLQRTEYKKGGAVKVTRKIEDAQSVTNNIIQQIIDEKTKPQQDNTYNRTHQIPQTSTKNESTNASEKK